MKGRGWVVWRHARWSAKGPAGRRKKSKKVQKHGSGESETPVFQVKGSENERPVQTPERKKGEDKSAGKGKDGPRIVTQGSWRHTLLADRALRGERLTPKMEQARLCKGPGRRTIAGLIKKMTQGKGREQGVAGGWAVHFGAGNALGEVCK